MNTQIAPTQGGALAASGGNAFESYGAAVAQRSIVGKLLKFSKGDYLVGENNEEVEEGTRLVANMDELMVGWIRWEDNRPSDQIMGRVSDGYQAPKRHELGDDDKGKWDTDEQGNPRDPWQFSNYLILKDPGGDELYTFTTSSRGGLNAIGELCKTYGKAMRQRPDDLPIVALDVGSYQHSNKAFGRIKFPIFSVVGWAPRAEFADAMDSAGSAGSADGDAAEPEPAPSAVAKTAASKKPAAAEARF